MGSILNSLRSWASAVSWRTIAWRWLPPLALLLVAFLGWQASEYRAAQYDQRWRERFLAQALGIAETFPPDQIQSLTFTRQDQGRPLFEVLRHQLVAYGRIIHQRSIYTVVERHGQLIFGPENLPADDPLASPPGTVYMQPPPELWEVFKTGQARVEGPYEDEYGDFLSAFAPVLDSESGEVLMVIGLDQPAGAWQRQRFHSRLPPLLAALSSVLILGLGLWLIRRRTRQPVGGSGGWKHLEAAMTAALGGMITLFVVWAVHESETTDRQRRLYETARLEARDIVDIFKRFRSVLKHESMHFELASRISRDEFDIFALCMMDSIDLLALGWVDYVPAPERSEYEQQRRRESGESWHLWERGGDGQAQSAGDRPDYYPCRWVSPIGLEPFVGGYDFGSEPVRRAAIEQSLATGYSCATPIMPLLLPGEPLGLLVFHPVFREEDLSEPSQPGVSRSLQGLVLCSIPAASMLDIKLIKELSAHPESTLYILDASQNPPQRLTTFPEGRAEPYHSNDTVTSDVLQPVFVFGRTYVVGIRSSDSSLQSRLLSVTWLTGMAGLLLTLVLTFIVVLLRSRQLSLEQQVRHRTLELHLSEQRFRKLFESSQDALLVLEPPGWHFASGNSSALKMYRVPDVQTLRLLTSETVSPETQPDGRSSREASGEHIAMALEKGYHFFEWRHRRLDGELFPASVLLTRIELDGKVVVQATVRDVTEQKQAEESLLRSMREWENTFNAVPDLIAIIDNRHRILRVNQAMKERLRVDSGHVFGLCCHEAVHGCNRPVENCPHAETMRTGREARSEVYEPRLGGWFDVSTTPVHDSQGALIGSVHVARDITERKRMEEALQESTMRLNMIFEHVQAGILLIEPETHIIAYVNGTAAALFGAPPDQIVGQVCHKFICPAMEGQCPVTDLKQTVDHSERVVLCADGRPLPVLKTVVPIRMGERTLLLESFVDISAQKHAEEYLRSIMNTIQAGVVVCEGYSQKVVDVNPVAARMLGLNPSEVSSHTWVDLIARSTPAGNKDPSSPDAGDYRLITPSGHPIDIRLNQAHVRIQDRELSVNSFIDISDIRRLLSDQEVNIDLATQLLSLIDERPPRHIDLSGGRQLFVEALSAPSRAVGGDHFFVRTLHAPGARTQISIKDQSGHEVNCILRSIMTDLVHHMLLSEQNREELSDTLAELNNRLCRAEFFQSDDYVTCFQAEIDHETLQLRYASCGHPPMWVIRGDQVVSLPDEPSRGQNLPLGFLPEGSFTTGAYSLQEGDQLLFHTDGFTEIPRRHRGQALKTEDLSALLQRLVRENPGRPVHDLLTRLLKQVCADSQEEVIPFQSNSTADDVTLLGLEILRAPDFSEAVFRPASIDETSALIEGLHTQICRAWQAEGWEDPGLRVRLVLEEAIQNAWKHAHQQTPLPIHVRWWSRNDFVLEVLDQGPGFDLESVPDPRSPRHRLEESGRGLFIMRQVTDELRWREGGRHVIATFARGGYAPPRSKVFLDYMPINWQR